MSNELGEAVKEQTTQSKESPQEPADIKIPTVDSHSLEDQNSNQKSQHFIKEEIARIQTELNNSEVNFLKNKNVSLEHIPKIVETALPSVASVIAHRKNPEMPVMSLTAKDIFDINIWLRWFHSFITFFSKKLGLKFDQYIEKKGEKKVTSVGNNIADTLDVLGNIHDPRAEFRNELTALYQGVTNSKNPKKEFRSVLLHLDALRYGDHQTRKTSWVRDITSENYPIIVTALKYSKLPLRFYANKASLAMPEIMKGVETFLRSQGTTTIDTPPVSRGGIGRRFVEKVASSRLQRVKTEVPSALGTAMRILPKDGGQFTQNIYGVAEDMVSLKREGRSNKNITRMVIAAN